MRSTDRPDPLVNEIAEFYGLSPGAVEAALAFARDHREQMVAQLLLHWDGARA